MKVYTYSEARQKLAAVLEEAKASGEVRIRRRDGQVFVLRPEASEKSPFDVPGADLGLQRGELLELIRAGRRD